MENSDSENSDAPNLRQKGTEAEAADKKGREIEAEALDETGREIEAEVFDETGREIKAGKERKGLCFLKITGYPDDRHLGC